MTLKVLKPAALLHGGPRHLWAYFVEDLEDLVEVERRCGREFPYRRTDRRMVHPRTNGQVESEVWEYVEPAGVLGAPPPLRRARQLDDLPDPWEGF